MPTNLNHNPDYLKQILTNAIRLHRPKSVEEATMLADMRDYFMYLTLDGLKDASLANTLIDEFSTLQKWLQREHVNQALKKVHPDKITFYTAFLFTLEQLLSLGHAIPKMPSEKISREDFMRSWKQTSKKLGFD